MNAEQVIKFFLGDVNIIDFSHFSGQPIIAKIEDDDGNVEVYTFGPEWLGYAANAKERDFSVVNLD